VAIGHNRHPAAFHPLERCVELCWVEQWTVPGQQDDAGGAQRLRADDPQRRRLRMADVTGVPKNLERPGAAPLAAERDALGPPLSRDHDHPLGQPGAGGGGQHVGEHRPDQSRTTGPVEGP
jgi:hypothetical protein